MYNKTSYDLLLLKPEWGSEYRNHYRGMKRDYIGMIVRVAPPLCLKHQ